MVSIGEEVLVKSLGINRAHVIKIVIICLKAQIKKITNNFFLRLKRDKMSEDV